MAKLIGICKDMPTIDYGNRPPGFNYREFYKLQEDALSIIEAASNKALDSNSPEGFVLSFGVADGHALYRVVKTKPLQIEHIPFGDAYQISAAHIRGINLSDVKAMMNSAKVWRNIFDSNH